MDGDAVLHDNCMTAMALAAQNRQRVTRKESPTGVVEVRLGSSSAKVYPIKNRGKQAFQVAWHAGGRRYRTTYKNKDKAIARAELAVKKLHAGEAQVLSLVNQDRQDYLAARRLLSAHQINLVHAVKEYTSALDSLKGVPLLTLNRKASFHGGLLRDRCFLCATGAAGENVRNQSGVGALDRIHMKHPRVAVQCLVLGLCGIGTLTADVKMSALFGDHMVLQQGITLPVWGTAVAGEKVTVTVASESGSATAGADGKWTVNLPSLPADATPVTMTVASTNTLTFSDVLIGDVWLCSGQSNMEFGLGNEYNASEEIPKANLPLVRLFLVPHKTSLEPLAGNTQQGKWVVCTPENVIKIGGWSGFSAVGYFFGREIQKFTGQPVGLIGCHWGGTPAQAWTSLEKLQSEPALKHYVDSYNKTKANYPAAVVKYPALQAAYKVQTAAWEKANGLTATSLASAVNAANDKDKAARLPTKPAVPIPPDGGQNSPTDLYNGMIAPLIPYGLKGAIWYQGESNAAAGEEYRTLFGDMINDWRERWHEGNFPFLWVQLAKCKDPNFGFAQVRESQLKTLALPNTGMAVAYDIGDEKDVHPKDKYDVGVRLALAAEHVAYGKDLVYSGPIFDKMQALGGDIRISFTNTGSGLVIGKAPWVTAGAQPLPTTSLIGFSIAGADQKWAPADARIDGNDVVVSSAQVPQPVAVRYAFEVAGNLYNKEGLPASPFRTDNWGPAPKPVTQAAAK